MLKFYVNGTPGGTDGTEVTSLTFKNFMKYIYGSTIYKNSTAFLPICVREENGYTATDVQLTGVVSNASNPISMVSSGYTAYPTDSVSLNASANLGTINNTNKMFYVGLTHSDSVSSGTEIFRASYIEDVN